MSIVEQVLVVSRKHLEALGLKNNEMSTINIEDLNEAGAYGFLPRAIIDDKSEHGLSLSLDTAKLWVQALPYIVIRNEKGQILTYSRKGKEKGLSGKTSIGFGGHIDFMDSVSLLNYKRGLDADFAADEAGNETMTNLKEVFHHQITKLSEIIKHGCIRELDEEIGLVVEDNIVTNEGINDPEWAIYATDVDDTSKMHFALIKSFTLSKGQIESMVFDEAEFPGGAVWKDPQDIKALLTLGDDAPNRLEAWSKALAQAM